MEAVGAAASVAGIIGFAGQALHGLLALKTLLEAVKNGPKAAATILKDIEALEQTVRMISGLIQRTSDLTVVNLELSAMIGVLNSHLRECCLEIEVWKEEIGAKKLDPSWKSILKRMADGGHKDLFESGAKRISRQQSLLSIDLSMLGRIYDGAAVDQRNRMERDIGALSDRLSSIHSSLGSISTSISCQPARKRPRSSYPSSWPSRPSDGFRSPPGHENQPEIFTQERQSPPNHYWTCDALSGIDDAFVYDSQKCQSICVFCNGILRWDDAETFLRHGRHLAKTHAFGQCNLSVVYDTEEEMRNHLITYHNFIQTSEDILRDATQYYSGRTEIASQMTVAARLNKFRRQYQELFFFPKAWKSDGHTQQRIEGSTSYLIVMSQLNNKINIHNVKGPEDQGESNNSNEIWNGLNFSNTGFFDTHKMCRALAQFDNEAHSSVLISMIGETQYRRICYEIGCLQEDLVIQGNEDILRFESYCCLWQYCIQDSLRDEGLSQTSLITESWPRMVSRLRQLPSHDLMRQPFEMDNWIASQSILPVAKEHVFSFEVPSAWKEFDYRQKLRHQETFPARDRQSQRATEVPLGTLIQYKRLAEAAPKRNQRVNSWLMMNFLSSISLRRILRGGGLLCHITDTSPDAWTVAAVESWFQALNEEVAEVPDFDVAISSVNFSGHSFDPQELGQFTAVRS